MAEKALTPPERDRAANEAAAEDRSPSGQEASSTWVWTAVAIIVLIGIVGGAVGGFISGRFYQALGPDEKTANYLLGVRLVDDGSAVVLTDVVANGPAMSAGLQAGDELRAIDAQQTRSARAARREVARHQTGDSVLITVRRNFRTMQVPVLLGIYTVEPVPVPVTVEPVPVLPPSNQVQSAGRLGVQYRMLQPDDPFEVNDGALIIAFLTEGTPAQQAGLRSGDIIVQVGRQPVGAGLTLSDALAQYGESQRVSIVYVRDGQRNTVRVVLGGD